MLAGALTNEEPLRHFLTLIGVKYEADAGKHGRWASKSGCGCSLSPEQRRRDGIPLDRWEFDRARNALGFSIDDVLEGFEKHLAGSFRTTGRIKKPRDPKAARAVFISTVSEMILSQQLKISDATLADLCSVLLQDEHITPSLVNRFKCKEARKPSPWGWSF